MHNLLPDPESFFGKHKVPFPLGSAGRPDPIMPKHALDHPFQTLSTLWDRRMMSKPHLTSPLNPNPGSQSSLDTRRKPTTAEFWALMMAVQMEICQCLQYFNGKTSLPFRDGIERLSNGFGWLYSGEVLNMDEWRMERFSRRRINKVSKVNLIPWFITFEIRLRIFHPRPIIFMFQKVHPGWVTDKCYDLLDEWKYCIITEISQGKSRERKNKWIGKVKEK